MKRWRLEYLKRIGYNGSEYERPELRWTQSSFMQPQMMIEDRYFYDPVAGRYTVDRYLDDLEKRYGGIDAVLVWHTYPNIGIDNRSQFDLLRDMPGGIHALKQMVADFHRCNVRVLFPMMLWDQGTLRAPDDVSAHPRGASPFGVEDLIGNVWQWTDEYLDDHTRAAILRGGSYYQPQGSRWYFPQAYKLNEHGKLLLMAPSKDRAATLGFRCVADAQ